MRKRKPASFPKPIHSHPKSNSFPKSIHSDPQVDEFVSNWNYKDRPEWLVRHFKGVWVPAGLFLRTDLTPSEKFLLLEIHSLDKGDGSFASLNHFATFLHKHPVHISRLLQKLKNKNLITIKRTGRCNCIKINDREFKKSCDISRFNVQVKSDLTCRLNQKNSTLSRENKRKDIYPEVYSSKNKNKLFDDPILQKHWNLSLRILKQQKKNFPNIVKEITNNMILSGADTLEKLERIDKYDFKKEIKPALLWAVKDKFWSRNIITCASLRNKSKSNEMKKFQNILLSWSGTPEKEIEKINDTHPELTHSVLKLTNNKTPSIKTLETLVDHILDIEDFYDDLNKDKTFRYHIYDFETFFNRYITFIEGLEWLNSPSISMFSHDHKIFKSYIQDLKDQLILA